MDEEIEGKVKWFNDDKGFGFITHSRADIHTDYWFHISSVIGPDSPRKGDVVEFRAENGKKGLAAKDVKIVETAFEIQAARRAREFESRDERIKCKHCGKRMVPRLKYGSGLLGTHERICPYCTRSQEGCFIASAVFDDADHPTVRTLREFRDQELLSWEWGKIFVSNYYKVSPSIAKWLDKNALLKLPLMPVLTLSAKLLRVMARLKKSRS